MIKRLMFASLMACLLFGAPGCEGENPSSSIPDTSRSVPRDKAWGIYALELDTEKVELLYSSDSKLEFLNLNKAGDTFAFSQQFGGNANENEEICSFNINSDEFKRITDNSLFDVYPVWSSDGARLAFLSLRNDDLDIYVMKNDGSNQQKLYDSGSHDADIDWVGDSIVFTSGSCIWIMNDDGTSPEQITHPPDAGVWGNANLPFGDYDPRLSPDGQKIAFERLEDDTSPHGNYNIFVINADGSGETRLTDSGYSQGIVSWSHSGDRLVFVVGAIDGEGKYDMYIINSDGSGITCINPDYFPPELLCHTPIFSADDSRVFFIGQWWE